MLTAVYPAETAVKPPFTNFANNHARDLIFFGEMTLYIRLYQFKPLDTYIPYILYYFYLYTLNLLMFKACMIHTFSAILI